jgi:hypothetical protein
MPESALRLLATRRGARNATSHPCLPLQDRIFPVPVNRLEPSPQVAPPFPKPSLHRPVNTGF